jgi:hypothetical protein
MARTRRLSIAFVIVLAGVTAGFAVYVGFVQAGLLANPFGPVIQGDLELARGDRPGQRVLFVGNSLTYWNDMPDLVSRLAEEDPGAKPLFAVSFTGPGWSLRRAERDEQLRRLLQEVAWDAVVLQEHSTLAFSSPSEVGQESVPAALRLQQYAAARGAETVIFMNWPTRYRGDLADQLDFVRVAPFASAWDEAVRRRPGLDLLDDDGRHPNLAGSYLAACVFYATLTGRDPTKSAFTAGLPVADARFLQELTAPIAAAARELAAAKASEIPD